MPTKGLEPTRFVSEGYSLHAYRCLRYIKKYAVIGTRTNVVFFEIYCSHTFNCLVYIKEIC